MKLNAEIQTASQRIDQQTLKSASNNSADAPQAVATSKLDADSAPVTPSVIYHGSEGANPVVLPKGNKLDIYRVAQDSLNHDALDIRQAEKSLSRVESQMKPVYDDFKQQLGNSFPQLANKEFGITVQEDGTLTIVNNKSQLSAEEQETISQFINSYDGAEKFSKLALNFAQASVDLVEADRGLRNASNYIGKFDLTLENFNQAFDFTPMLERPPGATGAGLDLAHQLFNSNLDVKYDSEQYEKLVDGEWVKVTENNK